MITAPPASCATVNGSRRIAAPMTTAMTVTRNSTLIASVAPASATSRKYRT